LERLDCADGVRADDWAETKPTMPDGTRPGLAVITEGELRRHHVPATAEAARQQLADYVLTTSRKQRRRPGWNDRAGRGGGTPHGKRGPQSCISNCMETDNMTFVRCRFLCR